MKNRHSATRHYEVVTDFPEWCDAEGEYVNRLDSEVEASEKASNDRRKYPPCSVRVYEVEICNMYGSAFESSRKLVGSLSRTRNWWRA
jgi:hypothetical protein